MHPAKALWARHHPTMGYPQGVTAVPEAIPGLAFFPGGYGLWGATAAHDLPEFPMGGIMVVGHDFHSEGGYRKSLRDGGEKLTLPTWSNLLKVLAAAQIPPKRCFFTNLYMGLREGAATTGPFPGAGDARFVEHCRAFFAEQLRAQQPSLVLTLGVHVPPVIGAMSPELAPWTVGQGLKHLDAVGPVCTNVTFRQVEKYRTTIVALIHPSQRRMNLRHRQYEGMTGADAEIAMLRHGIEIAGVTAA